MLAIHLNSRWHYGVKKLTHQNTKRVIFTHAGVKILLFYIFFRTIILIFLGDILWCPKLNQEGPQLFAWIPLIIQGPLKDILSQFHS